MEASSEEFRLYPTSSANTRIKNNSTLTIAINKISVPNRACISNKIYLIGRDNKNLSHITYFSYNKEGYYASIYTKPRKNQVNTQV